MRKGLRTFYEYVVLHHIVDDEGDVTDTKLLVGRTSRLEVNEETLVAKIYRELPEDVIDDLENVEIVVRPF